MDDIDRRYMILSSISSGWLYLYPTYRIAAAPAFPGLCRFPEGRNFQQWTGDDSKALMKVRLTISLDCHYPGILMLLISRRSFFQHLPDMCRTR